MPLVAVLRQLLPFAYLCGASEYLDAISAMVSSPLIADNAILDFSAAV